MNRAQRYAVIDEMTREELLKVLGRYLIDGYAEMELSYVRNALKQYVAKGRIPGHEVDIFSGPPKPT